MTTPTMPEAGECYAMPLRFGRWGACQVLGVAEDCLDVVAFDFYGDEPPDLRALESSKPLVLDHHAWKGDIKRMLVEGLPPATFRPLGKRPLVIEPTTACHSFGHFEGLALAVHLQAFWDREVPETERRRYKEGKDPPITIRGRTYTGLSRISLGADEHANLPLAADAAVDWSMLDGMSHLTQIEYHGTDASVLDYVASRKLLTALTWFGHGRSEIDVTGSGLHELRVDLTGPLVLRLPPYLELLSIRELGQAHQVSVEHEGRGHDLKLHLWNPEKGELPPPIPGLPALSSLDVARVRALDLERLAEYGPLASISAWGSYATLVNAGGLRQLTALEELTLYDFYDLATAELPPASELPHLHKVSVMGLRRSDAAWLKKHWSAIPDLTIHGEKNDAWIAANVDNPLRDWVDDDKQFGEGACKAYAKAYGALAKKPIAKEAEKILREFIRALNKLEAKYEALDTLRREQAANAYDVLVRLTTLDPQTATDWFEAGREF